MVGALKTWPKDFGLSMRMTLTLILIGALYLGFLSVLYYLGVDFISLMAIAALMLGAQYFFSDKLVLASTGAKIVSPDQAPELHAIIERLCSISGLPKPKVAIVPTDVPNAFATGRNNRNSVVAVTNGLLRRLNAEELQAVLGHELSHIKNRDMAVMTIASFLSTVAHFMMTSLVFGGFGDNRQRKGIGGMALVYIVSLVVYVLGLLLTRMLSRYRELAADRGSVFMTGKPSTMISALLKISGMMERVPKRDLRSTEGLNQFYIVPALTGASLLELFATHPSLTKRIRELEKLERQLTMGY